MTSLPRPCAGLRGLRPLLVDGTNVYASRPDGWWRDRPRAARRLVDDLEALCCRLRGTALVVFDRFPADAPAPADTPRVGVLLTTLRGRNAADRTILDIATLRPDAFLVACTSDRHLAASLRQQGLRVRGASTLLHAIRNASSSDPFFR